MHGVLSKPVCVRTMSLSAGLKLGGHRCTQLRMRVCSRHWPAEVDDHRHGQGLNLPVAAAVARGVNLAVTPSGQHHTGWRCAECLRMRSGSLLAGLAIGLASKACKRFGFTLWSGQCARRWSCFAAAPKPTEQETQEDEENTRKRIEIQVVLPDQPLHSGGQ